MWIGCYIIELGLCTINTFLKLIKQELLSFTIFALSLSLFFFISILFFFSVSLLLLFTIGFLLQWWNAGRKNQIENVKTNDMRINSEQTFVEVGHVWLELPSPIHSYKPNTSSIRKPSSTMIIIPSTADLYIYIYIYIRFVILGKLWELEIIPNNLAAP